MEQERKKTVVVTGGGNGIGEAAVRAFAERGYPIAVLDRDERGCARMERWARSARLKFLAVNLDVTELGQHRRVIRRIRKTLGPIGTFINAAGIGVSRTFLETEADDFDNVFGTNLRGSFFLTKVAVSSMRQGGNIIFITSVHQDEPVGDPTYSMSKAALKVLVKELALELAPKKFRVNGVAPGAIRHRKIIDRRFGRVPYGHRRGTPEEVAKTILFLCSPAASYITGELVTVDGGLSLVNWIATEGMQS